jgi:hypothetical protein
VTRRLGRDTARAPLRRLRQALDTWPLAPRGCDRRLQPGYQPHCVAGSANRLGLRDPRAWRSSRSVNGILDVPMAGVLRTLSARLWEASFG